MWSLKDRKYMYGEIFDDFYRYMGTSIPQKQVFDIKVDINKDPEGYEKLRQMAVDFFNNGGTVAYYADDLEYSGLRDFDAARDFIDSFIRIANSIGGESLNIQLSDAGEIFRQIAAYDQEFDTTRIGELRKLKQIAKGKSVFTIHELFDFFHFEFKTYMVSYKNYDNTYGSLVDAVMYVFNYGQEYILSYDRTLVKKLIKRWKEETENGTEICPYETFKDLITEVTSTGKGANSPLKYVFRAIGTFVSYVGAESKRTAKREQALHTWMQELQRMSKPVREF